MPSGWQQLSVFVNSVKNTSGLAASLTTCRKTISVTSSIGAKIKNGRGNSLQKFSFIIYLYPLYN
uniref:Uncharacterized protein n=1 Tax=Staphylococcus aureus TaxID=1280 RepID=Q936G2_STAAU|nr:unknown [Staphylococcus aureus]